MVVANEQSTTLGVTGDPAVERAVREGRSAVDRGVSVVSVDPDDRVVEGEPGPDCLVVGLDANRDGWVEETVRRPTAPPVVAVPQAETDAEVVETALSAGVTDVVPRSVVECAPSVVVERAVRAVDAGEPAYRSVCDGVSEPLALHDPETGEVVDANEALCDLLGYGRAELVATQVGEYTADVPGYGQERAVEVITSATAAGSAGPLEWPLETADGEQVWVEVELQAVEVGGRERVLSTATDVTEQRRRRRQLREISEHVDEVVYLLRADLSEVLFVNDAYEELFDQPVEALDEDPMAALEAVHPEDREQYRADLERMAEHVRTGGAEPVAFSHRLRVDGETRWVRVTGYPSRVPGDEVDRIVGVVRDVTETRRREREYEQIFNEVDATVTVHDPEARTMVDVNETMATITGYDREELLAGGVALFTADDADVTAEDAYDVIETVAETGEDRTVDWPVETADGERRWLSARATTATIGGQRRVIGVSQDVTERRRREREYEQIFNGVPGPITINDPETGALLEVNDALCEVLGYSREEILELGNEGLAADEVGYDSERAREIVTRVMETGEPETFEWKLETADGEVRVLEVTGTPAEIGGQQRYVSLTRDITARRQREREYEQIFNSVNDAIVVFDPDTADIVDVNDRYRELLGYDDLERIRELGIEGLSVTEEGYTGERGHELIREVADTGETTTVEWRAQPSDGDPLWLEATLAPATVGGERRVLSIQRDITARRQREREYEQIFNSVTDAIAVHDPETGSVLDVNDTYVETFGYDRETILEAGMDELSATEAGFTTERADEIITRVAETGESEEVEWRVETPEGDRRVVESTVTTATVGGERRVLSINRDVTERRRRQRQLEVIVERIDEAIYLVSEDEDSPVFLSDAYEDLTGLSLETLYDDPWTFVEQIHPDDRQRYREFLDRIEAEMAAGEAEDRYDIEYRFRRTDGERRWHHATGYPLEGGGQYTYIGVLKDITERRRREREYEQIFDGVNDAIVIQDPETAEPVDANQQFLDRLGYDDVEAVREAGLAELSATDAGFTTDEARAVCRRVVETGEPETVEWQQETRDGDRRWIEAKVDSAVIRGEEFVVSMQRDVTKRKRREREFEQIFDSVTDIITVYDPETVELIDVNRTMADLLGYDRETILELGTGGVSATELGYERSMVEGVVREVARTGEPIRGLEWALRTDSGETLWVEVDATPARISGEQRVLAIARDVTERRDREERIQVLNRVLRHNLRNDMDAVQGYATAIAEGSDESEALAERIRETADGLLRLSAKARDTEAVLRGDDGHGVQDVTSVVERVVGELRAEFDGADLSTACPAETVPVEVGPLELVLRELVENAAEHADAPTIEVTAERAPTADHDLTVTVADDGPGLPERALRPIRAGGETQFEHNRGLGLWLVHWGVRRLGGSVEFERPEDGGTVARLRLNAVEQ